ncbi:MAG TPA: sigma-70 family RNA polymerase sigma factor [Thermoanaerobaculia bacterium]
MNAPERWASERALLQAVKAGDTAAAEELVDRTYAAVFASACRLCGDRELAADLTQETYQKAWAALGSFDGRSQIFTWLYRIAYTTFLNHIRRPRRMTSLEENPQLEVADTTPGADELLSSAEEGEQLRSAVLKLSDDLRFTVTAHFWGGLAVREIAAVEGITTVAVRKRLHRAFTLLEAMLDEEIR